MHKYLPFCCGGHFYWFLVCLQRLEVGHKVAGGSTGPVSIMSHGSGFSRAISFCVCVWWSLIKRSWQLSKRFQTFFIRWKNYRVFFGRCPLLPFRRRFCFISLEIFSRQSLFPNKTGLLFDLKVFDETKSKAERIVPTTTTMMSTMTMTTTTMTMTTPAMLTASAMSTTTAMSTTARLPFISSFRQFNEKGWLALFAWVAPRASIKGCQLWRWFNQAHRVSTFTYFPQIRVAASIFKTAL